MLLYIANCFIGCLICHISDDFLINCTHIFTRRHAAWLEINSTVLLHYVAMSNSVAILNQIAREWDENWVVHQIFDMHFRFISRSRAFHLDLRALLRDVMLTRSINLSESHVPSRINVTQEFTAHVFLIYWQSTRPPVYRSFGSPYEINANSWDWNRAKKCRQPWKIVFDLYGWCKCKLHV